MIKGKVAAAYIHFRTKIPNRRTEGVRPFNYFQSQNAPFPNKQFLSKERFNIKGKVAAAYNSL